MPSQNIQWFPGHMAKTRRMIAENLKNVDIVIEVLDARIPISSRNPDIVRLLEGGKPSLILLNKVCLADPVQTAKFVEYYTSDTTACIPTDCKTGEGFSKIEPAVRSILREKIARFEGKGMSGRRIRAMMLGIPNVGKSSVINRICKNKKAKVEDRPGVTLDKQWVATGAGFDLMDMPGVLWPKFEDRRIGENLAVTGAIRDEVLMTEDIAIALCLKLASLYPALLCDRYNLDAEALGEMSGFDILNAVGKKRGFLLRGGEIDTERASIILLDEFRGGKIGRITLDRI